MSANNVVRIKEYEESPKFRVTDQCIELESDGFPIGQAETLEEAVLIANKYQEEEIVEYGIRIDTLLKH